MAIWDQLLIKKSRFRRPRL